MPVTEELERFAATGSTLVLHLAITRTGELADRLIPFYGAGCPAVVVSRATQADELVLREPWVTSPISWSRPACGRRR